MKFICKICLIIILSTVSSSAQEYAVQQYTIGNRVHIRALEVLNDSTVWFGANRGIWGFTRNGGKNWHIDSLKVDNLAPQFRSIAVLNDSTALLLSIDSPAFLFKTVDFGKHWNLVYRDDRKGIFFDCMAFENEKNGYALADPIDSCFQLFSTVDGGDTWQQTNCALIPKALPGEACFAASNSNVVVRNGSTWFVTGGQWSRLFYAPKKGKQFRTALTNMPAGETMTGAYSLDLYDSKRGVIAGGHYERSGPEIHSLAITNDGGITWKTLVTEQPFFGSCVRFLSREKVVVTGHDGTFIVTLTNGKTTEKRDVNGEMLDFYTLRTSPDRKHVWLAGSRGRIARMVINGKKIQ